MVDFYSFAHWLAVSAVIGVPLFLSFFILTTPADKLIFAWQNFRISRTKRSLKDRHFKRLPYRVRLCKILSAVVLAACVWAILEEFKIDIFALVFGPQ